MATITKAHARKPLIDTMDISANGWRNIGPFPQYLISIGNGIAEPSYELALSRNEAEAIIASLRRMIDDPDHRRAAELKQIGRMKI